MMKLTILLCSALLLSIQKVKSVLPGFNTPFYLHTTINDEWDLVYSNLDLKIESRKINYVDKKTNTNQERLVYKYSNLSDRTIQCSFGRKMNYDGICYGCNGSDKKYVLILEPKQVKEFSDENHDKTFYVFVKDLNQTIKKTLNDCQLINIEITTK